jgi:hypothetical protein
MAQPPHLFAGLALTRDADGMIALEPVGIRHAPIVAWAVTGEVSAEQFARIVLT